MRIRNLRLSIDTEVALTRFDDGGPDLGIRHGPGHWPGLTAHFLMDEGCSRSRRRPIPGWSRSASRADVAQAAADLRPRRARAGTTGSAPPACTARSSRSATRFSDSTDAMNAAVFGLGIALARSRIVAPYLDSGRLQRLPVPDGEGALGLLRGVSGAPAAASGGAGVRRLAAGAAEGLKPAVPGSENSFPVMSILPAPVRRPSKSPTPAASRNRRRRCDSW